VDQRSLRPALCHPSVEIGQSRLVEWHGSLRAELAQGDLDPGAPVTEVPEAVELEVGQLAESHPGATQDGPTVACKGICETSHGGHEIPVDVGRKGSGHGTLEAWDVAGEDELAGRAIGPPPHGQILEKGAQVDHRALGN
jgi:hypothetical protein